MRSDCYRAILLPEAEPDERQRLTQRLYAQLDDGKMCFLECRIGKPEMKKYTD